jgi:hypothetical protein
MSFTEAARAQYLHSSFYTVFLIGPNGEREMVGTTQRKSGSGLLKVLGSKAVQARVALTPDAETATIKKTSGKIVFSNGWSLEFGGTIRQEAV